MAYIPLDLDAAQWPHAEQFIRQTLEGFYFRDVHAMLRLPTKEKSIAAGCSFAVAHTLLAAVAGISTSLYSPGTTDPRAAFKGALVDFYPWNLERNPPDDPGRKDLAETLLQEMRGPLWGLHAGLPVGKQDGGYVVKIKRRSRPNRDGFLEKELEQLERSDTWPFPKFFQQTLVQGEDAKVLNVERFYWGLRQMVVGITNDHSRMGTAEAFLERVEKQTAVMPESY